jgi:hypothetical protein
MFARYNPTVTHQLSRPRKSRYFAQFRNVTHAPRIGAGHSIVTNLGYFAIPQAWFSTGDAKPIRDLKRDRERVNGGSF